MSTNLEVGRTANQPLPFAEQRQAAIAWGVARGWFLTDRRFGPSTLARSGCWSCSYEPWPLAYVDHPFYFRLRVCGGRSVAAAVVSHEYNQPNFPRIAAWAPTVGFAVEFPGEVSWYFPGVTRMVVFTPAPRRRP